MSQLDTLEQMFVEREYVPISELRMKFNYRSRISDLRKQKHLNIQAITVEKDGKKIHAYKMVGFINAN
jgi:hypothetical protein